MALEYIRGKDLNLYYTVNGSNFPVAHATDCKLKITGEVQETTTRNTLRGKTFDFTGKYSYTLSLDGITNFLDKPDFVLLQNLILSGTKIQWVFSDGVNVQYSGTVLLTSSQIDSPFAAISTFQNEMQGDGELSIVTTNVPPLPSAVTVNIVNQFMQTLAAVPAPGTFSVLQFDTIDCGPTINATPQLIITAGQ